MKLKPRQSFATLAVVLLLTASLTFAHTGTQTADTPEPIRVGVLLDLSGQTSAFGVSLRNGIQLAADQINDAGGVGGRRVQLFFEDDKGQPVLARDAAAKLIRETKVHALLGEVASSNSLAAAPVAQEAGIPLIMPASTNVRVTQVGDYIFRSCFTDPFQGELLAKFAVHTLKARRVAVLADVNSDYSRGIVETFTSKFKALGGRITITQGYTQTDTDFAAQLVAIRATKPDAIFVPGYYEQAGIIAKQAKQLGMKQPLLGGDGWDAPQLWQLGGAALNGSYMSNHYALEDPRPSNQMFVVEYREKYKQAPDAIAALGYDALGLLVEAIRRAGTTSARELRDAIAQTRNYAGVTGATDINATRDAVKPGIIFKLQDGKFIYHETIEPDSSNGN
jgi:branched-chain amino acid transport system substrate-binding protein